MGQTRPQRFSAEKSSSRDKSQQCGTAERIVFFNLVNLNMHLKKNLFEKLFENNYLKKFFSKRNWELMKKLDSFCKKL